jgi:hypothetical protein
MKNRLAGLFIAAALTLQAAAPDVATIIKNSVEANQRDFEAAPHFDQKERDSTPGGTKTYQDLMIDGSPYQRLIAINGKPLSAARQKAEQDKEQHERQARASQSPQQRRNRIAKYETGRRRDNEMMKQLTHAFNFELLGTRALGNFNVYVLKATPRPGYQPVNMSSRVLPGMSGELWIDETTFQWVKVTAQVIRPVSIEGFLAQVEPGTRFEVDKSPVGDGSVWLASHFAMRSNAKVLFMFSHNSQEEDTFWDYRPAD